MRHEASNLLLKNALALQNKPGNPLAVGQASASCVIASDAASIRALETDWRKVEQASPDTVLFQSFGWCRNHLEFSAGDKNFRPMVFTVRLEGEVVAILPLCLQSKGRLKVLTGFSEPFQQYTELLCDPAVLERAGREAVRDVLVSALTQSGADYFHFGQVREDGMLAKVLEGRAEPMGERDAAPYVAISQFADHEAYLTTIKSKTRKNLRNARNRLEREAPVRHEIARSGELMSEVVARVYEGREAWLERLGITSRAFQNADFEAFLKRFANADIDTGVETIAMSLKHGETAISDQWGFVYRGRYYAFMANWNPDYEAASPGRLHLGEVIRTCFDEGFSTADFMIPASSYKLTWTEHMTPVRDFALPLSLKGRIYTRLWLDTVRPLAKRAFFAMPAGLRSLVLKGMLNRN